MKIFDVGKQYLREFNLAVKYKDRREKRLELLRPVKV